MTKTSHLLPACPEPAVKAHSSQSLHTRAIKVAKEEDALLVLTQRNVSGAQTLVFNRAAIVPEMAARTWAPNNRQSDHLAIEQPAV